MITNWDIISHLDSITDDRLFTLVIDGSEHDARLIAKKLAGHVQEPVPAEPPFTFAFSLAPNLDEEDLDKIRTAVQEGTEQANKVEEFVPGGVLGNPLFNTQTDVTNPAQVEIDPQDSFLNSKPQEETPAAEPSAGQDNPPAQEINISDKDMLIQDMKETMLGQVPLEDIFSAETKYDMFLDLNNNALEKASGNSSAEDTQTHSSFNVFEQKIKDQTAFVDLEDLNAVTSKLAKKDLGFIEHAQASQETDHAAETSAEQEKPAESAQDTLQETTPAEETKETDAPETTEDLSAGRLPEDLSVLSVQPQEESDNPSEGEENHPDSLPEETVLQNTVPPAKRTATDDIDLPEITIRSPNLDELEHTFNLETTLSTEVMRTQYEKSFRIERDDSSNKAATNQPPVPAEIEKTEVPEVSEAPKEAEVPQKMEIPAAHTTLRLRKKEPVKKDSFTSQSGEPTMPEQEEGQTFFRIRRKQRKPAPQIPTPPPHMPKAPEPAAPAGPQAPAAPANLHSPVKPAAETPNPVLEKTKTIDHSIELPVSELRKHNWPLEVPLLPTYTLENLVLSVNRFAHATAISVIDNPGKMYNPLVFHGATGTGKTHFLNAMAYGFSKKYGQENVFMTNGVRLSRGIQRYVMEGNIEKFEKFMDSVKALLIDDIHLLAINEQNRAYISKLLNKFLQEQKQIVITSKYPPESLEKLEDLIKFRLDSGWISELKPTTGQSHFKIVKTMLIGNGVDLSDSQITQFFSGPHMTLSTIVRSIHRLKVLENLVFPNLNEKERSQADMFEKLLATTGEDPKSAILTKDPASITSITTTGNGEWGRLGFFYPSNNSNAMNWMVYALEQRAKELGIKGGFEIAVRSSYSTENIISSAFKIANLCDNKKLRGAVILGPALTVCEPSIRENFYDILTHMLEIMLIRCGIINAEALRLPSTYVKVISELLR
ncbi:MAG: ATP-binding protein [Elusimicrobiaceae bacterium]|nr:ATP-binding protein [Elusimicrobiaceae bacterium]